MPLIEKKILIEGDYGQTIVRSYYVNERQVNPYAPKDGTRADRIVKKMRASRQKTWGNAGFSTSSPGKGYTWSMGYNHCVGKYTGGVKYSRFTGSSLNRSRQLTLYGNENDMERKTAVSFMDAVRLAKRYYKRGEPLPGPLSDYLVRQDQETERGYTVWLSGSQSGTEPGIPVYLHELSARSRGKVKDKATAFFRAATGDRVFVTLTFLAAVDDASGVSILNKFLTSVRKVYKKLQYLWVAERQENGNIHFHLIMNKRLPVRKWNAMWVMAQYNAGIRGKNKFGEEVSMAEIQDRYLKEKVHECFNPLDIKKVKSIGALSSYLTKYITKQKKNASFACASWHCSRQVSRMFTRSTVSKSAFAYMCSFNNYRVDKETGECFPPRIQKDKPFYTVVYAENKAAPLKYLKEMEEINKWVLAGHPVDKVPEIDDDIYRKIFCKN
jgi:hypothetical protein